MGSSCCGNTSSLQRSQGTPVLQIECAQCVFDSVAEPDNPVLHIAAQQNDKGVALPEDLRSPHRTGTAWVIGKVLFHFKNSFIVAVRLSLQKVKLPLVPHNR